MSPSESPAQAVDRSRVAPLLRPIAADARAGRDARDDPRAELLRDEMLKDGYTRRDWHRVEEAARTLLSDATKDIVVAASWASAAYETEGLAGLAAGLALLSGMLSDYWDEMYPPLARRKVRESALDNFYEHLAARIPARTVSADEADELPACTELLESLHRTAQTRYNLGTKDERYLIEPTRFYIGARVAHLQAMMDYNLALSELARVSGLDSVAPDAGANGG